MLTYTEKKLKQEIRAYYWAFIRQAILFRYLLTPFGTLKTVHVVGDFTFDFLNIYVFGIRIVRIHEASRQTMRAQSTGGRA